MNDKFFKLPLEKQQRILNAAYKVFSQNSYKKAPMSEIADESSISKALLFHYFGNKKELYMYLWVNAIEMTRKVAADYRVLETNDFFEMLERNLLSRCSLMREYPHMCAFSLMAYYETELEIKEAISKNYIDVNRSSELIVLEKIDTLKLRKDIDFRMMYEEIFYAVDGYMLKKYRSGSIVPDEIQQEMVGLIDLWKTVYTHKGD